MTRTNKCKSNDLVDPHFLVSILDSTSLAMMSKNVSYNKYFLITVFKEGTYKPGHRAGHKP